MAYIVIAGNLKGSFSSGEVFEVFDSLVAALGFMKALAESGKYKYMLLRLDDSRGYFYEPGE